MYARTTVTICQAVLWMSLVLHLPQIQMYITISYPGATRWYINIVLHTIVEIRKVLNDIVKEIDFC